MDHLIGLNEAQRRAVLHREGPLLVIAGAGAGKTKTLAHRILHLIRGGVAPSEILAITFTNKAADEMRERVRVLLSERKGAEAPLRETPVIKTFHSLGVQILKEDGKMFGLPRRFSIIDEAESSALVKEAIIELTLDPKQFEPRRLRNLISREKGDLITAEWYAEGAEGYFPKILSRVWRRYEEKLANAKALDFDDLILKTVVLLSRSREAREKYQNRFRYIHIDEYQDTNEAQYELSKLLSAAHKNICVVGDSDQNIYGWRGANLKNILNFEKDYPGAEVVLLEENYRSTKRILSAANRIIEKNTVRKKKNLFTKNKTGEKIGLFEAYDEEDEARYVARKAKKLNEMGVPHKNIAVLYRANFQSRALEEAFITEDIPYQVLGVRFFERKEVKDVLAYIRLAAGSESAFDLKRALSIPPRGLGKVALLKVLSRREAELSEKARKEIEKFKALIAELGTLAKKEKPSLLLRETIRRSGIEKLWKGGTEEEEERLQNAYELSALAARYDAFPPEEGIEKFLEDAALFSEQDALLPAPARAGGQAGKEERDGVKLMTVHASKGLEFSHVFITGLEQDLFPHARASEQLEKEDEEEERRLFYVALTRAEEKLYLSFAMTRTIFGGKQLNEPSEFIFDIPPELLEKETREETGKVIYLE